MNKRTIAKEKSRMLEIVRRTPNQSLPDLKGRSLLIILQAARNTKPESFLVPVGNIVFSRHSTMFRLLQPEEIYISPSTKEQPLDPEFKGCSLESGGNITIVTATLMHGGDWGIDFSIDNGGKVKGGSLWRCCHVELI